MTAVTAPELLPALPEQFIARVAAAVAAGPEIDALVTGLNPARFTSIFLVGCGGSLFAFSAAAVHPGPLPDTGSRVQLRRTPAPPPGAARLRLTGHRQQHARRDARDRDRGQARPRPRSDRRRRDRGPRQCRRRPVRARAAAHRRRGQAGRAGAARLVAAQGGRRRARGRVRPGRGGAAPVAGRVRAGAHRVGQPGACCARSAHRAGDLRAGNWADGGGGPAAGDVLPAGNAEPERDRPVAPASSCTARSR